jgi:hypothetical protein
MLVLDNFIKNDEESDDNYSCYNISRCVDIFSKPIEDSDELKIYIKKDTSLVNLLVGINQYLEWLCHCEDVLKKYYESELGEKVYEDWFKEIEVYNVDITFNSINDYGATISCGDQIILDHSLEIDFDKMQVEAIRLNG